MKELKTYTTDAKFGDVGNTTTNQWLVNGYCHRTWGPAVTDSRGLREWYKHGTLHRRFGPAVIHPDGLREWWINGKFIKEK